MAHQEQRNFVEEIRSKFLGHFLGTRVLEIGSLNVNGTVRDFFHDCEYIGVDIVDGPGVDVVSWAHELEYENDFFDVAVSCEALEHDPHIDETLNAMTRMLRPGGLMVITAAGPSRMPHEPAPGRAIGHYRNVTMGYLDEKLGNFSKFDMGYTRSHADVYFWGMK